jgi:membrane protease YdiL (CAAX protease family)
MSAMFAHPRRLFALWLLGAVAAVIYAHQQHIPLVVAVPVTVAFLVELTLFFSLSSPFPWRPKWLLASALLPYLLYSIPTHVFHAREFFQLVCLTTIAVLWLRLTRDRPHASWLFLGFVGVVYLTKVLRGIYLPPLAELRVDALGQLMWFRVAMAAWLREFPRHRDGFGFLPARRDWLIGVRWFALFLPVGAGLVWLLRFGVFTLGEGYWWKAPLTFAGIFLVVGVWEEFFFRGVLLERMRKQWGNRVALAVSSAVFGIAHLWFRDFPNWKFALIAGIAGLFYGSAYLAAGNIRAAVVAHALVVAFWRAFVS